MTTLIQLPNTPEIFAKVERRLAEAIHGETIARSEGARNELASLARMHNDDILKYAQSVREWRGLHQALKRDLPVHVDAAFYWSLTNE